MTSPVLQFDNLVCGYDKPLIEPLTLNLAPSQSVALTGKSGVGKTSILNTILGFIPPFEGNVIVEDQTISKLPYRKIAQLRSTVIGTVFQRGELLSRYTAVENVALARLLVNKSDTTVMKEAAELLSELDIVPDRLAADLSGGERQRVALARALINNPRIILADEPTGSLDPENRDDVMDRLFTFSRSRNTALVLVTHDPIVADLADSQVRLVPVAPA